MQPRDLFRALVRLARNAHFRARGYLETSPLPFIGLVVVIAVAFRLGIDVMKR